MIKIVRPEDCCGCSACACICPRHCISMTEDKEGFLYPHVNKEACVNCGMCDKVCPIHKESKTQEPIMAFASYSKDEFLRKSSSSGGVFSMLAETTINEGGVVFGAKYDENWNVIIGSTSDKNGLAAMRGSKYVQASIADSYKTAKKYLQEGRKVLYSGTPCQIAGLKSYLKKEYDNLLSVDLSCHGVPSPLVWRLYLNEILNVVNVNATNVLFRDKKPSWESFNFTIRFDKDNGTAELSWPRLNNTFMKAFLSNMILRPSCSRCLFKDGRGCSDVTLADYWGIDNIHQGLNDDKGISLVIARTEKGIKALHLMRNSVLIETDYIKARAFNEGLKSEAWTHPNRWRFFRKLHHSNSIISLIEKCLRPTLLERFQNKLMKYIIPLGGVMYNKGQESIVNINNLQSIDFRSKSNSWENYNIVIKIKFDL